MPLYVCRRWEGIVTRAGGPAARLGAAEPAAGLPDAAGGRAADRAPDDAAVIEPKRWNAMTESSTTLCADHRAVELTPLRCRRRARRAPRSNTRMIALPAIGVAIVGRRRREPRLRTLATTSLRTKRRDACSEAVIGSCRQRPAFSPADISVVPQRVGEPRFAPSRAAAAAAGFHAAPSRTARRSRTWRARARPDRRSARHRSRPCARSVARRSGVRRRSISALVAPMRRRSCISASGVA